MTIRSESRSRIRIRSNRRLSPCYRHPDEVPTGICASCLRERLSGLDSCSGAGAKPEFRRCRSVISDSKCEASSSGIVDPRRNSCDVVSSLSNLFDVDEKSGSGGDLVVESKNLGLSRVTYTVIQSGIESRDDEVRVSCSKLGDSDGEVEGGEFRTMKEYIDLECESKSKKSKDLRGVTGNLWGAASAFSKKLRKWGHKSSSNKVKRVIDSDKNVVDGDGNLKLFENGQKSKEDSAETARRRSCDTEPRFLVDGGRISFEKPRASWDGYMIARTIPRLTPMVSAVENGVLGDINRFESHRLSVDGPMHSILEDDSSSGGSGNFNSDSSSSMRQSSFDCSSSVKSFEKKGTSLGDHGLSPANVKLVITEKELKDWHLSSRRGEGLEKVESFSKDTATIDVGNMNVLPKKPVKWSGVCDVFGFRPKNSGIKSKTFGGNFIDPLIGDTGRKQGKDVEGHLNGVTGWKLTRSSSVVAARKSCDGMKPDYRRRSVDNASGWAFKGKEDFTPDENDKHSSTELENGIIPFYMTPLRSLRRSKSGKFKLHNSHPIAGNILRLN